MPGTENLGSHHLTKETAAELEVLAGMYPLSILLPTPPFPSTLSCSLFSRAKEHGQIRNLTLK